MATIRHREPFVTNLSGSLLYFLPVQVLRLLQMSGSTGRLELVRDGERAELFVVDGRPAFARTSGYHERLGDVLVDQGEMRAEAIEFTAALQKDRPGDRLGDMLVQSGALDPARLRAAVLEVQRRIICRALLWQDGEFHFHPGERAENEDITLALDLDRLIVEALLLAERRGDRPELDEDDLVA